METQEMREFFQRVVDEVATLSTQAAQVEGLQQQITDLRNRITTLEQSNYDLQQQLNDSNARAEKLSGEASYHQEAARQANEHVVALRDTIIERDKVVSTVATELKSEQDSHTITKADLADARRAAQEWETHYNTTKDELTSVREQYHEWHNRADALQAEKAALEARLDRIMDVLNPGRLPYVAAAS